MPRTANRQIMTPTINYTPSPHTPSPHTTAHHHLTHTHHHTPSPQTTTHHHLTHRRVGAAETEPHHLPQVADQVSAIRHPGQPSCDVIAGHASLHFCLSKNGCAHVYMHTFIHTCMHTFAHAYIHSQTHIHTSIHTHIHVCIHTYALARMHT